MSIKRKLINCMPDKLFLQRYYKKMTGHKLNLNNPQTFCEKLQWLKLYDRRPLYTIMVDKYAAKDYVGGIIGQTYIIPTLGVWEQFDAIDFAKLPDQFVLKCTHDSGGLVICKDKSKLNIDSARSIIERSLTNNYYYVGREWPYKNVPPRIIAEQFMEETPDADLRDYKFYCFNGKPIYCQVISDRRTDETIDFFDMDWNHQEFTGLMRPYKPFSKSAISAPKQFMDMKRFAELLSKDIPFVRVDFYEVKGHLYFGELTFYPGTGFGEFSPTQYNQLIGDLLMLPQKRRQ